MPTSATGTWATEITGRRRRAGGFTLVEILVVVLIIGVVSAGILLSVRLTGRDPELEKESARLLALLNYAREQAELQTRDYGVIFQDDAYQFVAFDVRRNAWRVIFEDDALRERHLPEGLTLRVVVEGRNVVLTRPKDASDKTPQIMLFASGDLTSCEITLERDGGARSVTLAQDEKGQLIERAMVEGRA